MPAARAWSIYEGSCSTLLPSPDTVTSFAQDRTALGLARIEAHYFAHGLFLEPGGLLAGMGRIGHIPAEIVQGRYDMICPACTAFDLAAAWQAARLTIVPDAGHSALEPGIPTCPGRRRGAVSPRALNAATAARPQAKDSAMKVGVIGLGTMGMGAALNLHRKGHQVVGCELREASRAEFIAAGATAVASPDALPGDLEAVVVFVINAAQTEAVLFGAHGCLQRLSQGAVML